MLAVWSAWGFLAFCDVANILNKTAFCREENILYLKLGPIHACAGAMGVPPPPEVLRVIGCIDGLAEVSVQAFKSAWGFSTYSVRTGFIHAQGSVCLKNTANINFI